MAGVGLGPSGEELSAYELKRLETIAKNAEFMRSLGIEEAAAACAAHKPARREHKKDEKKKGPAHPRRRSRRSGGELPEAEDGMDGEDFSYRDPNDVSAMTPAELHQWADQVRPTLSLSLSRSLWGYRDGLSHDSPSSRTVGDSYRDPGSLSLSQVRQTVLRNDWLDALTAEQQERVRQANDTWLGPFAAFTARFGGHGESPVSVANLKNVLQQVMRLVSGAGVTCKQRAGCFAQGR